jgi:hypothetical protein
MSDERLVPVFIPSLVSVLLHYEQEKGSPLSEEEVISIRDASAAVMVPESSVIALIERRGYQDIDPEHCWELWQEARKYLISHD